MGIPLRSQPPKKPLWLPLPLLKLVNMPHLLPHPLKLYPYLNPLPPLLLLPLLTSMEVAEMGAEMGAKKTDEQRQQQQMLNVAIKLFRTKLHKEKSQAMLAKTIPLIVWLHGASALDTKTLS